MHEGQGGGGRGGADLEVHTLALVGDNEERVDGALGPAGLLRRALAGKRVALQAGLHGQVGDEGAAAAALDGDAGGLGPHSRCLDHNAGYLHQPRHVLRLRGREGQGTHRTSERGEGTHTQVSDL